MKYEPGSVGYCLNIFETEMKVGLREGLRFDRANLLVWREWLRKVEANNTDARTARRLAADITEHIAALRLARIARGAGGKRESLP